MNSSEYNWFKGDRISVGIYGESHSQSIGVKLTGLDFKDLDEEALRTFMKRRAPGRSRPFAR